MPGGSALMNALVNTVTNYEPIVAAFSAAVLEFVRTCLCSSVKGYIKGSILGIYIQSDRLSSSQLGLSPPHCQCLGALVVVYQAGAGSRSLCSLRCETDGEKGADGAVTPGRFQSQHRSGH